MRAQCYLTEHDKKMKRLQQSVEHNQSVANDYKKSMGESEATDCESQQFDQGAAGCCRAHQRRGES